MTVATPAPIAPAASVTPTVSPGHRLVPAAIGRRGREPQRIFIECASWCVEDHVADCPGAIEDIVHTSAIAALGVGSFLSDRPVFEMYASVKADVGAADPRLKGAHVVLDDGTGEDAFLTPGMADEYADRLVAFAEQVRNLARTAQAANRLAV